MSLVLSKYRNIFTIQSCPLYVPSLSEDLQREIDNDAISSTFLRETFKYLDGLKEQIQDLEGYDKIHQFYTNMQVSLHHVHNLPQT